MQTLRSSRWRSYTVAMIGVMVAAFGIGPLVEGDAMSRSSRLAVVAIALAVFGKVQAQEAAGQAQNIEAGKTPAQLYASDCAVCHKTPQGLSKGGGLSLSGFLKQHYTASAESASALAAYLTAIDRGAAPAPAARSRRKPKTEEAKPGEAKPGEAKPADAKPADGKAEAKPAESKPAESKPAESQSAAKKPAAGKPAEAPQSE